MFTVIVVGIIIVMVILLLAVTTTSKAYSYKHTVDSLDNNPYMELGTGVENILHLIRIDFIWRVTPLSKPAGRHDNGFGIFGSLKLQF